MKKTKENENNFIQSPAHYFFCLLVIIVMCSLQRGGYRSTDTFDKRRGRKGLTMVNGEFVEIQLNESVLERTHLNKDFDTEVVYTMDIESAQSFENFYAALEKSLPPEKQLSYVIAHRSGLWPFIGSWLVLFALSATLIIPVFILLFLTGKLKFKVRENKGR
ncbi:hypothetical protein QQ020_20240 [Fulvivirgaceae bacterium BMA12]|uniref:Uncharacterized protein n=1 Tax=Agaribacillus aureus TaxID=3051825 RepID=A0ABT8LBL0_9BACT|nr:hypothetical protein [Fulvivirgaceae bacterium BMA12]